MLRTCQGCNSQPDVNEEIFHFLLQCIKLSRKNIIYYQEPTILYDLNINEVRSDLSRGKHVIFTLQKIMRCSTFKGEQLKYFFNVRREISYFQAAMNIPC